MNRVSFCMYVRPALSITQRGGIECGSREPFTLFRYMVSYEPEREREWFMVCSAMVSCFSSRPVEVPVAVLERCIAASENTGECCGVHSMIVKIIERLRRAERRLITDLTITYLCSVWCNRGWGLCGREERVHKNMMSPLSTIVGGGNKERVFVFLLVCDLPCGPFDKLMAGKSRHRTHEHHEVQDSPMVSLHEYCVDTNCTHKQTLHFLASWSDQLMYFFEFVYYRKNKR